KMIASVENVIDKTAIDHALGEFSVGSDHFYPMTTMHRFNVRAHLPDAVAPPGNQGRDIIVTGHFRNLDPERGTRILSPDVMIGVALADQRQVAPEQPHLAIPPEDGAVE